ncbi:family 16 glycosylhydrolase [Coraliomargarita akajimensis]|nr:family 16 glycosylhydrolase [Coraliomargarita akajimensis]
MPPSLLIVALVATFALQAQAADWDEYPVPAAPPMGYEWQLDPVSDDFNYNSPALPKTSEFTDKWVDHFINNWQGPGFTDWEANHSLVQNGHLELLASRKGTSEVYAGAVSSHATFTYPLYVEVRVKINRLVTATGVWMLSADSEEEIDIAEAYGSDRVGQEWYAQRMHLSHHVFVRNPFQDYQPTDSGTWYHDGTLWADDFRRIGVYWRDPYHLEYYVDGVLVRTTSGEGIIDPQGYTDGTGLSEPMHLLFTVEDQTWRSAAPPNGQGLTPTDEELADPNKNTARVDWLRVYKAVPQAVQAEIATTDTEIALNFSKARPYLFYQVLQAEGLDAPNWTPALTDLQFNSQGLASLSRTIESTQHFFRLQTDTDAPVLATFDWEEYAGEWYEGYNQTETHNGISLLASGRSAVHDGGDGRRGSNGQALKANYAQDAVPGAYQVQLAGAIKDFQVLSVDVSADEGAQAGSVYLEGRLNGALQWTLDPVNQSALQTYTTATSGELTALIDEILWHGPTATQANPGGTVWNNSLDNLTVLVRQ